jgi:tRNA guanosine-2'-O-methyltransferase
LLKPWIVAPDRQTYEKLPRHPLVVCASLVENPMNLGALCRTTEAFRLEALVLADRQIAQRRKFRQLAAATHSWQPLEACPPDQLGTWLQQQQQRGYSVLGLTVDEQAEYLSTVQLPQKAVLVLGRELTGIPEAVLQACDRTLTIPQYGLVDSLNVQTAAAIAIYEYIRQWGLDPSP